MRGLELAQEIFVFQWINKLVGNIADEFVSVQLSRHNQFVYFASPWTGTGSKVGSLAYEMQQTHVGHTFRPTVESISENDSRHWVDVQLRNPFAELGRLQILSRHRNHLLFDKKLQDVADLAPDQPRPILMGVECFCEKVVQPLL